MKKVIFSGSSDDLFEIDGDFSEEIGCFSKPGICKVINSKGEGLHVIALYAPLGIDAPVWSIGIAPLDEDIPILDWPIHYELAENGYSTALVIEVPDKTKVIEIVNR